MAQPTPSCVVDPFSSARDRCTLKLDLTQEEEDALSWLYQILTARGHRQEVVAAGAMLKMRKHCQFLHDRIHAEDVGMRNVMRALAKGDLFIAGCEEGV